MGRNRSSEEIYICMRKVKAFGCSLVYYICRIFPIKKTKIVMWTFEGSGGYACSPKYVAEEILRRNQVGETNFEIVWLVNDWNKEFPAGIRKVKSTLWSRAYHLSTAKFWIANTRTFYGAKKRKGTKYFQTWHGSISLKPIGKCRGDKFSKIAYLVSKSDSDMIDYVLSGSHWCTNMWRDGLIYDGEIKETGSPRCDVLFSDVEKKHIQLRKEYGIPTNAKICLYAPTFRGGSQSTQRSVNIGVVSLEFNRLIAALEKKFDGTWYVFLRLHPQLAAFMKEFPVSEKSSRLIDVSQRSDMAEILAATDAIITDYSTIIFEGFLTGQPGFIYADDLDDYIADRGTLMFDLDEIPFPVAQNNENLIKNIVDFDAEDYRKKVSQFIEKVGILEDGLASRNVVELMLNNL